MKRSRLLLSTLTAAAVSLTFPACDKKPADSPKPPPASEPAKPGAAAPATPAAVKTAAQTVVQPPAATPAEAAKLAGLYGFVAQLPKDVEGFGASYRLHDLWSGLANSKWTATLLELPPIKSNPEFVNLRMQWDSEQGKQAREILQAFFGKEFTISMPAGFSAKAAPWMEFFSAYQQTMLQAYFMMGMSGGTPDPAKLQQIIKDAAPQLVPILAKCEMPPLLFSFNASNVRPIVDGVLKQVVEKVGKELPPAFEASKFKVSDKHDFQAISVNVRGLIPEAKEAEAQATLTQLLGDEAKAKEVLKAALAKRVEVAWGWVGETLVLSIGTDHSHVKFAASEAESALAIGEVAKRAGQFAAQKPHGLSYFGKSLYDSFAGKVEFAERFKAFAEELQGILKPEQITEMVTDARRIEKKAQDLFATTYDSAVQVDMWEGGFRTEIFGGPRNRMFDGSKPLLFGGLAGASTFFLADGRTNAAYSKATADLIEDFSATLWSWYEKYGRQMVPESERQGAAMIEATAKPMLVDFWRSTRKLGQGLGDETAFVLDLSGPMPKIPDLPPFLAEGKVPRIAWVSELKDRAAVSEAWKGYASIIKQVAALAGPAAAIPEPQVTQEGAAELHFVPLPMPTDDLLPHVAMTKDRWILSTAPSLSKEIIAKTLAATGNPLANHWDVNFAALYDYADGWLKVLDKNGAQIFSPTDAEQYTQMRPLFDAALKLGRSLQGFEWHMHEEGGLSRNSLRLKIQDLK